MTDFEVLNSFCDSIAVIDKNGQIVFTNSSWKSFAAENSAVYEKTCAGVNYFDQCRNARGEDRALAMDVLTGMQAVISGDKTVFEIEYPCHSPDERRWFLLRVTPVESRPDYIIVSHINITKRRLAEEAVESANEHLHVMNERLRTAQYKLVHDIIGPINSIGRLITLTKDERNQKIAEQHFHMLEKSIYDLKDFIQKTLQVTTRIPKAEAVYFRQIIDTCLSAIQFAPGKEAIDISVSVNQPSVFYSDTLEVRSILSNLLTNCVKYHDPKKEKSFVEVNVNVTEHVAEIEVKDNGIGIEKDKLTQIFDLNYQVQKSEGAGVGLYLVKKSVEFLKGSIVTDSEPGRGTSFRITLPNAGNFSA